MIYTYNEQEKSFGIYTNFRPESFPEGYVEITEEEYNRLIEEQENNPINSENK